MNNDPAKQEPNQSKDKMESFFDKFEQHFKIDFLLFLPLALFLLHIRVWTFIILASVWGFFGVLKLSGMSIKDFRQWLRKGF